jgi:Ion transport protein
VRKVRWDLFLGVLILYTLITIPMELCFTTYEDLASSSGLKGFDYFVNIVFFIDVILNFNIPYFSESRDAYIAIRAEIARRYLKFWFFVDLLSSIPFDTFVQLAMGNKVR